MVKEGRGRRVTVLTGLAFVVTECSVEGCEHSELIFLEFVLGFWC